MDIGDSRKGKWFTNHQVYKRVYAHAQHLRRDAKLATHSQQHVLKLYCETIVHV